MTYSYARNLFDRTPWDTNEWVDDGYEFRPTNRRQTQAGMLEADVANNLAAQLANMTSMLQTLVLRNQASVDCPQCGGGHLYDMCPYNLQSICSVQNNPYGETYNSGWRNHLDFE